MSLIDEVDALYEQCVCEPHRCSEQFFADWSDAVASGHELDRTSAKLVRRCLRAGQKLAAFWSGRDPDAAASWRSRVDVALGARAWRPQLELARYLLESAPGEEHFDAVARLFPVVFNEPFLDGVGYEEWLVARGAT